MPQGTPQLPDPAAAQEYLVGNVRGRVFLDKLASLGHPVNSEAEAISLLELSSKLAAADNDPRVKAAEAQNNLYAQANSDLDIALSANGLGHLAKSAAVEQQEETHRHQLAASFANDPNTYNSVLSYKAAEAEMVGQTA